MVSNVTGNGRIRGFHPDLSPRVLALFFGYFRALIPFFRWQPRFGQLVLRSLGRKQGSENTKTRPNANKHARPAVAEPC